MSLVTSRVSEFLNEVYHESVYPDWRERLKSGTDATTYMIGTAIQTGGSQQFHGFHKTRDIFEGTEQWRSLEGDVQALLDLPSYPGDVTSAEADNAAKMEFIKKALQAQRSLQGLVSIGELRETLNLIRHPLKTLRNYADNLVQTARGRLRTGRGLSPKNLRKVMADTWLEWAFGAVPLVSDVKSGAIAAAKLATNYPQTRFIKGEAGRTCAVVDSKRQLTTGVGLAVDYNHRLSSDVNIRYYGSISTTVPGSSQWQSQFGVTFHDVVPAAWELIPFSFLVDYFTNAQEIINAACFPSASIRWLAKGEKRTTKATVANVRPFFNGSLNAPREVLVEDSLTASEGCELTRTQIERNRYEGNLIPPLQFEIPGLSSKKWLNIAALAASGRALNGTNRL